MDIIQENKLQQIINSCTTEDHLKSVNNIFKFIGFIPKNILIIYCQIRDKVKKDNYNKEKQERYSNDEKFAKIIIKETCNEYNINIDEFNNNYGSRERKYVEPTQMANKIIKERTTLTLRKIGQLCRDKHHANVLHSIKTINNLIDTDILIKQKYKNILHRIYL